jgi:hypothetical protein
VLGLLGLPFGIFAPFAVWSGASSLRRISASRGELNGTGSALLGFVAGVLGLAALIGGTAYWLLAS